MRMGNVLLLLLGLLAATTVQAELYRYVNRQGVVVLENSTTNSSAAISIS